MADVPVPVVFLAVAAVTLAGFWAGRLFQRTRLPDALPLLLLGLVIGPMNRWASEEGFGWQGLADVMSNDNLQAAAPVIAGLALVVLLFESGMQLDFGAFGRSLGPALWFTIPLYAFTVLGVAVVGHWILGMPLLVAVVLGVALVNVDQTVSTGVLNQMRIDPKMRATYIVEMALYDLISIPLFVSLLGLASGMAGGDDPTGFFRGFATLLSVSLVLGAAGGLLWVFALRRLQGHPHSYMLTFAVMLGTYGLSELLGGSGALSTLVFGLLLGNRAYILRRFGQLRSVDTEHEKVQAFHDEITFFIRTVFFLFLGASFSVGLSGQWEATSRLPFLSGLDRTTGLLVLGAVLILIAIVAARILWTLAVAGKRHPERKQLFPLFGRGLDTAVLATVPFLATAYTQGQAYHDIFDPWKPVFLNISLMTVLLTVVASGLAVYAYERRAGPTAASPAAPEPPQPPPPPPRPPPEPERGAEVAVPARGGKTTRRAPSAPARGRAPK